MTAANLQAWIEQNPIATILGAILACILIYLFTRNYIARGLISMASRTKSKVDDILLKHIRPARTSLLAPLAIFYLFAYLLPEYETAIKKASLFLLLWISILTISSLLDALNEIYENNPNYTGVSIQGYLDISKIAIALAGIILSISLFSDESPIVLLTGLGALTAVLLLIFQDTILALVASIQIATHDLIKEGDWLEVPSYDADGDVVNISLHRIKIQNFDKTFTVIPTHKIVDVAYKNWRGMTDSGGRRIQRSILVDMTSIRFCDEEMLERLQRIDRIQEFLKSKIQAMDAYRQEHSDHYDSPLDGPQITNIEVFRAYISAFLKERQDVHHESMPFLVRTLSPTPAGLPIELYIFTRTTQWEQYENIQAEIFDHLLAAAGHFDLRVFQEPTGLDFASFARGLAV